MHAVEQLIVSQSHACLRPAALAILSQVPALRFWGDGDEHERETKLGDLVPRWIALNDTLFWHTVAMARAAHEAEQKVLIDDWDVTWIGHFWRFDAASFPRTLDWITTRDHADDRSLALSLSFRTYAQNGRRRAWRRMLWRAVEGDAVLEAKLRLLMRPGHQQIAGAGAPVNGSGKSVVGDGTKLSRGGDPNGWLGSRPTQISSDHRQASRQEP